VLTLKGKMDEWASVCFIVIWKNPYSVNLVRFVDVHRYVSIYLVPKISWEQFNLRHRHNQLLDCSHFLLLSEAF